MTTLFRSPFFIIIATITFVVMMINYPIGSSSSEGLVIASASFAQPEIAKGENTTLLVVIDNLAPAPLFFELQIIYTNNEFLFYDNITGNQLTNIVKHPTNYTLIHPVNGILDKSTTLPILLTGPTPKGLMETFEFSVEVYAVTDDQRILWDTQTLLLTVTYSS